VFHPFDGVLLFVDGVFVGVVSMVDVCCIKVFVCAVEDL
jgi:hypothetical protein